MRCALQAEWQRARYRNKRRALVADALHERDVQLAHASATVECASPDATRRPYAWNFSSKPATSFSASLCKAARFDTSLANCTARSFSFFS